MWFLLFLLVLNSLGLAALLVALGIWRRESGGSPAWIASRRGLGALLVAGAGAALALGASYRMVHWIVAWRRAHHALLANNPYYFDSPILPEGIDFLSARMAAITAGCVVLMAVGAAVLALVRPRGGDGDARGKGTLAWSLALALIVTLAELSAFQYYDQKALGMKGLPFRPIATHEMKAGSPYRKSYEFRGGTELMFAPNIAIWEKALAGYKGKPDVKYLEVGIFEGHSTLWMLENVLTHPTARLTGIDPFFPESSPSKKSYKEVFYSNLKASGFEEKADIIEGFSQIELRKLPLDTYDIIYIDGSHDGADTLEDAVLALRLLKEGGLLIFDDYLLNVDPYNAADKPKVGIDAFVDLFYGNFDLVHSGWQVILKKKSKGGAPQVETASAGLGRSPKP